MQWHKLDPFADMPEGVEARHDMPELIMAPADPSFRMRASIVVLSNHINLMRRVQEIAECHDLDVVAITSPLTLLAFPQAVAQVADPACGTRSDWRLFVDDLMIVFHADSEVPAPLLLFGDSLLVDAAYRRVSPWRPITCEAYHEASISALLHRIATLCTLRKAFHE